MVLIKQRLESHPQLIAWGAWLISRSLVVLAMVVNTTTIDDVKYYFRGVTGAEAGALQEYPAVGVWPLWLIERLNFGAANGYVVAFVAACIAVDAAFFALIHKYPRAAGFWIIFGAAMAFVLYLRIDIIQGVLVALAAWFLAKNSRVSSILIGIAAMMKLWPAVLAAGLVDKFHKTITWVRVGLFAATCLILGALVVAFSGIDRLISPLTYQQVRGLQIESIFATPFMVLSAFMPGKWKVEYASSKSFEIFGPFVRQAAEIASWTMFVVIFAALCWAIWHFFWRRWSANATLAWMVVIILLLITSNKVFSPQYLLWVGPLVAVVLVREENNPTVRRLAAVLVVMAVVSTLIYPIAYAALTAPTTSVIMALVLAIRNALLIVAIVLAVRYLIGVISESQRGTGSTAIPLPEAPTQQPTPLGQPS